jgi:hypothetical protein
MVVFLAGLVAFFVVLAIDFLVAELLTGADLFKSSLFSQNSLLDAIHSLKLSALSFLSLQ